MTTTETLRPPSLVEHDPTVYPESDGEPMAENTEQFKWIVTIKENLEALFASNPDVFVAGDLLWYPVQFQPTIRRAPDAFVVFGRPKGRRGAYLQWQEDNLAPQVVFEVLSPGNRVRELLDKFIFYQQYGAEEYYIYDPDTNELLGYQRHEHYLAPIEPMHEHVSPRLGIRFVLTDETLEIYRPDGKRFLTFVELEQQVTAAEQAAAHARAEAEHARSEAAAATARAERLAARLRELGIEDE